MLHIPVTKQATKVKLPGGTMFLFQKFSIPIFLFCITWVGLTKGSELDVAELKREAIQSIDQTIHTRSLRPFYSRLRAATRTIRNLDLSLTPNRVCYTNSKYRIALSGDRRMIICPRFYRDSHQQRLNIFLKASFTISRLFSGQREIDWIIHQIMIHKRDARHPEQTSPLVNRHTNNQSHDLKIEGSLPFKRKINDALNYLRQRAPRYYEEVINNVEEIVEHRNRSSAVVQKNRIEFSNYGSVQQETLWVAGIIYHETQHILQYKNRKPYVGRQAEEEATREQERLLRYVNAPQRIIDHINQALDDIFWDLDGDGEYTHRDFNMRNY